jgi:hypothetical protein
MITHQDYRRAQRADSNFSGEQSGKVTTFARPTAPKLPGFGNPVVTTTGYEPSESPQPQNYAAGEGLPPAEQSRWGLDPGPASGRAARCPAPRSRRPHAEVPADPGRHVGATRCGRPRKGRHGGLPLRDPVHAVVGRPPGAVRPGCSPPDRRTVSPRRPLRSGHSCRKVESRPSLGAPSCAGAYHCDSFLPRSSEPPGENRSSSSFLFILSAGPLREDDKFSSPYT